MDLPADLNRFSRLGSVIVSQSNEVSSSSSISVKEFVAAAMMSFFNVDRIMKDTTYSADLTTKTQPKMADFDKRKRKPKYVKESTKERRNQMADLNERKTPPK